MRLTRAQAAALAAAEAAGDNTSDGDNNGVATPADDSGAQDRAPLGELTTNLDNEAEQSADKRDGKGNGKGKSKSATTDSPNGQEQDEVDETDAPDETEGEGEANGVSMSRWLECDRALLTCNKKTQPLRQLPTNLGKWTTPTKTPFPSTTTNLCDSPHTTLWTPNRLLTSCRN